MPVGAVNCDSFAPEDLTMPVPAPRKSPGFSFAVRQATRPLWAVLGERLLTVLIYLCGISAIIFVLNQIAVRKYEKDVAQFGLG